MGVVVLTPVRFHCDKCRSKSCIVYHGRYERPKLPPGWSAETVVIHGDYPAYDESKDLYYCKVCTDAKSTEGSE